MKTTKKTNNKFSLEKFEVAKLKNMRVIHGGLGDDHVGGGDPGEVTKNNGSGGSSQNCAQ